MKPRCVCGCGGRAAPGRGHHVVYQQHIKKLLLERHRERNVPGPLDLVLEERLLNDKRNLVPISRKCHAAHHNASKRLPLRVLPDSVFEFARELLGAGAAFEYLRRRYAGNDPRLDALLSDG